MNIPSKHPPINITILGCGPSAGVPLAGYEQPFWGQCDPTNPLNRRTRSSIYVEVGNKGILVDTTPDLRHHLLTHGLMELESVIITHDHADHIHGIDELRPLYFARGCRPLPLMADASTLKNIQQNFGYLFKTKETLKKPATLSSYPALLVPSLLPSQWQWQGLICQSFPQDHGYSYSQGLRFGPVAYSTDFVELDEHALTCLQDLELWIVDCLARTPRSTHCHLAKTLMWIDKVKPKAALLTHMNHELDYGALLKELPPFIRPAYDGLKLRVEEGRLIDPPF